MKLLLDTHTVIWHINGDDRLSGKAKRAILSASNSTYVSIASIWEMSIKVSLGKLKINYPFQEVYSQIEENGFEILPIVFDHTLLVTQLEFHHRDPFDRLLVAQAIFEKMAIVTKDEHFHAYGPKLIW